MKKKIFFTVLFIASLFSTAQNFAWATSFGGNATAIVSTALDASGNIYIMGNYSGSVDFDPGPGVFSLTAVAFTDIYITKLDANGNFIWAKSVGGNDYDAGKGMILDDFGGMYITGSFAYTADFDPSPSTATLTSASWNPDIFILKLDLAGNFLWAESIGGWNTDVVTDMNLTNLGYLYITGTYSSGGVDFNPSPAGAFVMTQGGTFILKLDFAGNFVWAKTTDHYITALALDSQDNIYLSGQLYNTTDFDPGPGTYTMAASLGTDVFVSKWTGSGNFVWAKKIGGPDFDYVNELRIDGAEVLYISGTFADVVDFNPGPGTYTINSGSERCPFICKLDSAGSFMWARHLNVVSATTVGTQDYKLDGLAIDAAANVVIAGGFNGTLDFDPGPGTYTRGSKGSLDIFMLKLDASGNFSRLYTAGNMVKDVGAAVSVNPGGDVYLSGTYGGTVDFNPDTAVFNLTSPNFNAFILKLNGPDVGLQENTPANQLSIYPNPTHNWLTVSSQPGHQNSGFEITDLLGRPLLSGRLNSENQVDLSTLPAGSYLLRVGQASARPVKFIKQ